MTSRRSSGSMRVESAVEPTKSENITVTWRRSAASTGGPGDAACPLHLDLSFRNVLYGDPAALPLLAPLDLDLVTSSAEGRVASARVLSAAMAFRSLSR